MRRLTSFSVLFSFTISSIYCVPDVVHTSTAPPQPCSYHDTQIVILLYFRLKYSVPHHASCINNRRAFVIVITVSLTSEINLFVEGSKTELINFTKSGPCSLEIFLISRYGYILWSGYRFYYTNIRHVHNILNPAFVHVCVYESVYSRILRSFDVCVNFERVALVGTGGDGG